MPSSSAYAAPIDLDLRPGRFEQGGRVVAGLSAAGALALSELTPLFALSCALLAILMLFRDDAKAALRPTRMRLFVDGGVECAISSRSALPPMGDDLMRPAALLQASSFLGLTQLHWADTDDRRHACILFPDRLDSDTRHRLRVWLATHRPEDPMGMLLAGGAP